MRRIGWMVAWVMCLASAAAAAVPPPRPGEAPAAVVGRIFHVEGELLRYVPEEEDWVAVVRDAPFGEDDTLFAGRRGRAELIVPNGTWTRIGNDTQIQFIALDADLSEVDVASGLARFYNKSSDALVKATSPFGYVLADPGTAFDFYVGDNSVEVVALSGSVTFVHSAAGARYDVAAGSPSILADQQRVSSGGGDVDPDWDRWNRDREDSWAAKARVRGRSAEVLPPSLQDDAYVLEENGSWERVPYEGAERWFWRPRVDVGWSPFTVGRWTDWDGDQTWIPAEPFGYVTHHYGNWIYVRNSWYWAPPVVRARVGVPLLDVGFFWYPGRVSWIHRGTYVGWVPLAPRETYYAHRHWGGPHVVVVNQINITQININVINYAYARHAVVVDRDNFCRVNSYRDVRMRNINRAAIGNYRAAPVVTNTVINNYTTIKQRYNYTNVSVREKPHNSVVNRIRENEKIVRGGKKERASVLQERVKGIPEGKVNREARIEAPKVTEYLVPANEVNRPKAQMKLRQRELRRHATGAPVVQPGQPERARPERRGPEEPGPQGKKAGRPESPSAGPAGVGPATPVRPGEPRRAGKPERERRRPEQVPPERVTPSSPGRREAPRAEPEQAVPATPAQPGQPRRAGKPPLERGGSEQAPAERVGPARPGRREPPRAEPERAVPPAPALPGQPRRAGKPELERGEPQQPPPPGVAPETPSRPGRGRPERGEPERPGPQVQRPARPEQPGGRPERGGPARPVQPGRPQGTGKVAPQTEGAEQAPPGQVVPAKPGQPEGAHPGRRAPKKPGLQEEPSQADPSTPVGD